jgi:uncharacterized membrane protein YraQ (UPF0718 family)
MFQVVTEVLVKSGYLLWSYLPYILIGILIAEILKYTPWANYVKKAVSGAPIVSILVASILGIISPLCTVGTIPLIIDLYRKKVPLAPLLTFLSASSLMNPQLFLMTWAGLGIELTLMRLGGVIMFTLLLGTLVLFVEKKVTVRFTNKKFGKTCDSKRITKFVWKDFVKSFYKNFEFIGFYIILGIVLSVLIETLIPLSSIFELTQGIEWINVIAASFLGIPLYACGGATIPVVNVLLENGISPGAAIGFLIVGPGTRIAPLLALGSFLSRRTLGYYVVILLLYSIVLGLIANGIMGI